MKRVMASLTTAVGMLSLMACGSKTEPAEPTGTSLDNLSEAQPAPTPAPALVPGQAFANAAAASDAFEIAASKLALEKAQSKAIKSFAEKMVAAHTESTAKLKSAAASAPTPVTPDATLTAAQQDRLAALQAKSGAAFDTAYAAEQVAAHQAALDTLRSYAAAPDEPALGQFATTTAPIVAAHLNMAKALKP
ncbi:hypothetical protein ACFB49_26970 [Sphingomonas sp. DBB INV C78]|uniref:DUF4142 domain-containing protein n=1 Tax=Sphingomonas sp. DBB INV C78 TaxID=3349434 RepID=UPI0036D2F38A